MTVRLLILEGHPITRFGLARMVDDQPDLHTVGETDCASTAFALAHSVSPDVVSIDTEIDGGWALARDLRDLRGDLGIVIFTSNGCDDVLFRALETGASAFVSKLAPASEILAAIRHSAVASSSFSATGLAEALRNRDQAPDRLRLSPREAQVLTLLQDGMSVPAIAGTLFVSLSTAKTYVARLYEKLGATNRAQALMSSVQLGLIAPSGAGSPAPARVMPGR